MIVIFYSSSAQWWLHPLKHFKKCTLFYTLLSACLHFVLFTGVPGFWLVGWREEWKHRNCSQRIPDGALRSINNTYPHPACKWLKLHACDSNILFAQFKTKGSKYWNTACNWNDSTICQLLRCVTSRFILAHLPWWLDFLMTELHI